MYAIPSSSRSSMTCLSIMQKKMLNRVGAWTQPCFTLLMTRKDPEQLLFNLTWPHWSLYSWITILRNFVGQPRCYMIIHNPFLLTMPNTLVRSTNWSFRECEVHIYCHHSHIHSGLGWYHLLGSYLWVKQCTYVKLNYLK